MPLEKILVTGGAGFIGANVVRRLIERGYKVTVLDDFSTGRWENLTDISHEAEVHEGDVRDLRALRRAAAGVRAIFHLAALPCGFGEEDATRVFDVNVKGTLCALMAARENRTGFVFPSSASVYGGRTAYLLHEELIPEPRTALGAHKIACENYCRLFYEAHNVPTVVLRLFGAFGPYEEGASPHAGVVARFAHAIVRGQAPVLFGDGSQTRDLVYVENVADAFLLALRAREAAGGIFNVGTGEAVPISLLYHLMTDLAGFRAPARRGPARPGEPRHVRAALGHSTAQLKYAPRVRLREGLQRTLAWHKERPTEESRRQWFAPPSDQDAWLDAPPPKGARAPRAAGTPTPPPLPSSTRRLPAGFEVTRPMPAAGDVTPPLPAVTEEEVEEEIPLFDVEELGA